MYNKINFYRAVDNVLNTIDRSLNDMTIKVWRPFATNAIVHVINGRTNGEDDTKNSLHVSGNSW